MPLFRTVSGAISSELALPLPTKLKGEQHSNRTWQKQYKKIITHDKNAENSAESIKLRKRYLQHKLRNCVKVWLHVEIVLESAGDVKRRLTLGHGTLNTGTGTLSTQWADQRPTIGLQHQNKHLVHRITDITDIYVIRVSVSCAFSEAFVGIGSAGIGTCTPCQLSKCLQHDHLRIWWYFQKTIAKYPSTERGKFQYDNL